MTLSHKQFFDRQHAITRRHCLGLGAALALCSLQKVSARDDLEQNVADILMLGFSGNSVSSPSARILSDHIARGRVNVVFFVRDNVGSLEELNGLIQMFRSNGKTEVRLAIDHEGGLVQRLLPKHGCRLLPKPFDVAHELSLNDAQELYRIAGHEIFSVGFDINLAPVVDLHDPNNPAIGRYGRAFSSDPVEVADYAEAFIRGFESSGLICALKHFPGHGSSKSDSHDDLPLVKRSYEDIELDPFRALIDRGLARIIMGGHLRLPSLDKENVPTTLSRKVTTGWLRDRMKYTGVIMTDDIDMVAVANTFGRKEALIKALAAGNDLIMIRNETNFDPDLPVRAVDWIGDAIKDGKLSAVRLAEAAHRARALSSKRKSPD